jgi:predicted enzyme related to lactoylglutathione lyase
MPRTDVLPPQSASPVTPRSYRKGEQIVPNPVVHFEIIGPDAPKLQSFYRDLFDWKVDADNEWNYGMVETGGEGGINGGVGADPSGANRSTIYVAVDDPQKYLDKAASMGADVLMPVTDMGIVTIAMFSDPAGNITGLVKDSNGNGAG